MGYHIGNSLTWDSSPEAVAQFAALRGHAYDVGFHINCNRPLSEIVANPQETCVEAVPAFGFFGEALWLRDLDAITMQPFPGNEPNGWVSTMGSDLEVMRGMIALARANGANADTRFYIYQGWPGAASLGSGNAWSNLEIADELTEPTALASAYFDHLFRRLSASTDADVRLIPVGAVLSELADRVALGQIPWVTNPRRFYRDQVHMSFELGRFVAAATTYATLFRENPAGLHEHWAEIRGIDSLYADETYRAIEAVVWYVVGADPRTGVAGPAAGCSRADLTTGNTNPSSPFYGRPDGLVSGEDLSYFVEAWLNGHPAGDTTTNDTNPGDPGFGAPDGTVNGSDLSFYVEAWLAGCP